jgi:ABC-type multidrug transport system ATPase subunit
MSILQGLVKEGRTVILVTHESDIAAYAGRVITLRDGLIIADKTQTPLDAVAAAAAELPPGAQPPEGSVHP